MKVISILTLVGILLITSCTSKTPNLSGDSNQMPANQSTQASSILTTSTTSNSTAVLRMVVDGGGTVSPLPGVYTYALGTQVTIIATGDNDWPFNLWIGNVANTSSPTTTITMDSDQTVIAYFAPTND